MKFSNLPYNKDKLIFKKFILNNPLNEIYKIGN